MHPEALDSRGPILISNRIALTRQAWEAMVPAAEEEVQVGSHRLFLVKADILKTS